MPRVFISINIEIIGLNVKSPFTFDPAHYRDRILTGSGDVL